jgi:putative NADPH-quinone reductase
MGMPTLAYRLWYRAHSLKNLERNVFRFIGFAPVRSTLFGMVDQADKQKVAGWLKKVKELGQKAI